MDALVAQRQLIKGKWHCDFPNMKPDGENSLEFKNDGTVRQVVQGTSTRSEAIQMYSERVDAYSVNLEGLLQRIDDFTIHQMSVDGQAVPADRLKSMEQGMLAKRQVTTSPIIVLDPHNLVLGGSDETVASQLKCTR